METFVFPMSFGQQRLWLLDQLEPGQSAYHIAAALRLEGALDAAALERSLNEIVRRHEALRTTFSNSAEGPIQLVASELSIPLIQRDLRTIPPEQQLAEARRFARELAQHPFDLATGPLLRLALVRLGDREHLLISLIHHIIADGWSMGVFTRELAALYDAFRKGRSSPLAELALQYSDFACWQRDSLRGPVLEEHLAFWKRQLDGAPPVLDLPSDRPRPAFQTYGGKTLFFELDEAISRQVKRVARESGGTVFMTLLSAFALQLSRYSGQDDLVLGTPVANRTRSELEPLIGFFVNTLPLRIQFEGVATLADLLRRVRSMTLEAYAHQDLPFEQLVEALQPERDLSTSPLFQVMFVVQNAAEEELELPGLTLTPFVIERDTAMFDLTLAIEETAGAFRASLEYNSDLFDLSTAQRMAGHFETLLRWLTSHPAAPIAEAQMLTRAEEQLLLIDWNRTQKIFPSAGCVHRLIEEQVERTPDAVAVAAESPMPRQITYRELNSRANQLAGALRGLGLRPGVLAAVCAERSIEMVVALLAIVKAGGAYVPLDPSYPPARLAWMVSDARAPVVLTLRKFQDFFRGNPAAAMVFLDDEPNSQAPLSDALNCPNPESGVDPSDPVYVIYTSGSTGKPKGSQVCHGGFANLLHWFVARFRLGPSDRPLLVSSLSFDLTQKNIFAPLLAGGTLVLSAPEYDPAAIRRAVERYQATWLNCTPSAFYPIVEPPSGIPGGSLDSLRYVFLGGEPIAMPRLWPWLKSSARKTKIANTYGPTECTDICAACLVEEPESFLERPVPIGRAIDNVRLYILDNESRPVPVGVPGELWIGGAGVGPGYLNDPALTADKFRPDRFSSEPGARLYRTGDLVRYLAEGDIEFLGRKDFEVKLRGFRIDPGEIEASLREHADVLEAVVLLREEQGDRRLAAYVVARPGVAKVSPADLRGFLGRTLPDHMVPGAFVFLDRLPLTPSGKVDRRALPAIESGKPETSFVAPRNSAEVLLAQIWTDLLRRGPIGAHDNFFERGGHSLLAIQVISRVRDEFQVELPLRLLFEKPTLAELSEVIITRQLATADDQAILDILDQIEPPKEAPSLLPEKS